MAKIKLSVPKAFVPVSNVTDASRIFSSSMGMRMPKRKAKEMIRPYKKK